MVDIGHAADTQKGLIISPWYNKPWSFVLRAKDAKVGVHMADICKAIIQSGKVRYSQNKRNTLFKALQAASFNIGKIGACYADCSSLMAVCAYMAGVPLDLIGKNAPTTRTMEKAFMATGMFERLTEEKYTHSSDYLRTGDILDVPNGHTVMALDDGSKVDPEEEAYKEGEVYTLKVNLKVRSGPSIYAAQLKYDDLTADGKKHAFNQTDAGFRAGTRVTCKGVKNLGAYTWILCPSGWVCAVEKGRVYIA